MEYCIYTDGGCSKNNKAFNCPGAYAFILTSDNGIELYRGHGKIKNTTNNRMEMVAAIEGIKSLITISRFDILKSCKVITDSKYLVDGYHEYLPNWEKNGWKKADGGMVMNQDLWKALLELKPEFGSLRFQWVRGHSNHRLNCEVDTKVRELLYGQKSEKVRIVKEPVSFEEVFLDANIVLN